MTITKITMTADDGTEFGWLRHEADPFKWTPTIDGRELHYEADGQTLLWQVALEAIAGTPGEKG